MYQFYSELLTYCIEHRRDRVMATIRGAGRCAGISDFEYFGFTDMVKRAGLWEAK